MDCNRKYDLVRMALVSAMANDKFREVNDVECDAMPELMKFVRDCYYAYYKYAVKERI